MKSITRFITQKLKLEVNEAKSEAARPQSANFLALASLGPRDVAAHCAEGFETVQAAIRDITRRAKGVSMKTTMADLAPYEFNNPRA
jgi:RNA-directed DNA polymerase